MLQLEFACYSCFFRLSVSLYLCLSVGFLVIRSKTTRLSLPHSNSLSLFPNPPVAI